MKTLDTRKIVVDQPVSPVGRTRCHHDMLNGECAWCLGHDIAAAEFSAGDE